MKTLLPALALISLCSACVSPTADEPTKRENPINQGAPVVDAQGNTAAMEPKIQGLNVSVFVNGAQLSLNVGAVPEHATLECALDQGKAFACNDGAQYVAPAPGVHRFAVVAKDATHVIIAQGSATFQIATVPEAAPQPTTENISQPNVDLTLTADSTWVDDAAIVVNQPVNPGVTLVEETTANVTLQCKVNDGSWASCPSDGAFTATGQGRQRLAVRAQYSGNTGNTLNVSWYSVPAGYSELMLRADQDAWGRNVMSLVRDKDCAASDLVMQCAYPGTSWANCSQGNIVSVTRVYVRATCAGKLGPNYFIY